MHAPFHAPAVRYPCGRSALSAWALAAVAGCGLACTLAWLMVGTANGFAGVKAIVGLGLWLLCAASAWRGWRALEGGHLAWDGGQWWLDEGAAGESPIRAAPRVHLDLQSQLLLSAQTLQGRPLWFWLERRSDPLQWAALRRAVYSPAHDNAPAPVAATDAATSEPEGAASPKT
ncbi:MAG: hypothetical protein JSS01_15540 [Proteobacteria bacterium]|nr:hypothetical protein [Pseudomonadota bacterium]